jgi:hypothetical protein
MYVQESLFSLLFKGLTAALAAPVVDKRTIDKITTIVFFIL